MRKLENFLTAYLDYTEQQESPETFHVWSAMSLVSMALGRKCYVDRGFGLLYPNQYIVLVSDSARCRKTTATDIAISLYSEAGLPFLFRGKITGRALSKYLAANFKTQGTGSAFLYAPELEKIFGSQGYASELMVALTDLYGCPKDDSVLTSTQGGETAEEIFVNLLGATIPSWLSKMPAEMVEGGFSSRCLFVVENTPRKACPRPILDGKLRQALVNDLIEISKLAGPFKETPSAQKFFDDWYERHYSNIDLQDLRVKAYFARKGEHVYKVAMCISASVRDDLVITELELSQAIQLLEQIEPKMPRAFSGMSFSSSTRYIDQVLEQVEAAGGRIEWNQLVRANRYYMSREELDKLIDTLTAANLVRIEIRQSKKWIVML